MCIELRQHTIRHVSSLKIKHVQRFRVYSIFVDNSFQFSESVYLLYQLMWHISCSLSVPIDSNLMDLNPVSEVAIQLDRLSWKKRLVKWCLILTRKWGHRAWTIFVYVAKEYLPITFCLYCKGISPKSSNKLFSKKLRYTCPVNLLGKM